MPWIKAFAPASIGNIGPGFDVLGLAIEGFGDVVEARKNNKGRVIILDIQGNKGILPKEANKNTAGIAAIEVIKILKKRHGYKKIGVDIKLYKGIPIGSGLGSSSASAVASAYATNALFGEKLSKEDLLFPATYADSCVSGGFFADNTASELFGGAILVKSYNPLQVIKLGSIEDLIVVVITPDLKILTKDARAILPKEITMKQFIYNMANSSSIAAAFSKGDINLLRNSINDFIIEPARAKLIPGFYKVKKAAMKAGALGCSISGAGPTLFAFAENKQQGNKIGKGMQKAFLQKGLDSTMIVTKVSKSGAKLIAWKK